MKCAAKKCSGSAVHWYPQDHVICVWSGVRTIDYQGSIKVRGVWCYQKIWVKWPFQTGKTLLAARSQTVEGEAFTGALGTGGNNVYVRYLGSMGLRRQASSHTSNYKCEFGGEGSEDLSILR